VRTLGGVASGDREVEGHLEPFELDPHRGFGFGGALGVGV
jgi:hypothetical protein